MYALNRHGNARMARLGHDVAGGRLDKDCKSKGRMRNMERKELKTL